MRKETLLVALTWFLVVASITMCANATAGARLLASEQVDYPQGKLNLSSVEIMDEILGLVGWSIWLMRNKVIFNDGTATFKDIFSLILYRLSNWLKSADKFFMATDTTLIMGPEDEINLVYAANNLRNIGASFC
ncbi:hypothetical protein NC651_014903 [Populus alba x Populus x berolinensis]|nr:hypothetical protein NC651_014903 [Populus alba x Populus x berolinensis]